ncbi:sulfite exporter TauE/SafE family protein [Candidatus Woesearchaeota archaeon]|nr:sulfite exporter TauE/SafE family protein [Candidatus Woesearchaeota archaeon]
MEMLTLLLAFIIAFGTMFLGAISGGVGLVLRPLLIFIGFPAIAVVGSVRVASVIGEMPGIFLLHKNKKVDWDPCSLPSILPTMERHTSAHLLWEKQLHILGRE